MISHHWYDCGNEQEVQTIEVFVTDDDHSMDIEGDWIQVYKTMDTVICQSEWCVVIWTKKNYSESEIMETVRLQIERHFKVDYIA